MSEDIYKGIRVIEVICIGIAVFGALWKGTEILNLDTPEFMMVYGSAGAIISEARDLAASGSRPEAILGHLSTKYKRNSETIRAILRKHDRAHPSSAILPDL